MICRNATPGQAAGLSPIGHLRPWPNGRLITYRTPVPGQGAAAERLQRGGTAAERLCGRVPESAGNVSPWIAAAAKKPPVTALWGTRCWERTVRRILFAGFEALCVFGYLELVYHLLNLTIHKDRQVVG